MRFIPIFIFALPGLFFFLAGNFCQAQSLSVIETGTDYDLHAVYFSDQLHGWAAGEAGTILKTSDGGLNWETVPTQFSDTFLDIAFFDHQTGWLAGSGEILLFTNNAGRTWADYRPGSTGARNLHSLYTEGLNKVRAGGGPGQWYYLSENSGLTWQRKAVLPESCTIMSLHFTHPGNGFFTACGTVWNSRDGGQTWLRINAASSPETDIHKLFMTGTQTGYAMASDDSGTFIQRIELTGTDHAYELSAKSEPDLYTALYFLNDRIGWAAAQNGGLWQTTDGGSSWEKIETGTEQHLQDIHALESGTVWISGDGGMLIRLDYPVEYADAERIPAGKIHIESETEALDLLNRVLSYGEFAMELNDPLQRSNLYRRMALVMEGIRSYYSTMRMPQAVADRLRDIPAIYFAEENNRGAELYNGYIEDRQNIPEDSLHAAVNHLTNAAIILPDSSTSWLNLAFAQHQSGNAEPALSAAEKALETSRVAESGLYNLLIELYLITGRRDDALSTAIDANALYPDEPVFLEYLADMEISSDEEIQPAESASLDRLIETYPAVPRYRYARALSLTGKAMDFFEQATVLQEEIWDLDMRRFGTTDGEDLNKIRSELDRLINQKEQVLSEALTLADQASNDLYAAIDSEPGHTESHALLGRINVNIASFLEEIRLLTIDEDEAVRLDEEIQKHMRNAAAHYRRAADLDPANRVYRAELEQIERFLNQ